MSDLCIYELEDNVWDEFGESGDHIVPHPDDEQGDQRAVLGDSCKKSRREVINETSRYDTRGEERTSPRLTKDTILEKDPWFQTQNGVNPASCDSNEATSVASDNTRMSGHYLKSGHLDSVGSKFCPDDPISSDKCAARESNLYHCSINDISQKGNAVGFLDNDHEDRESSDLLYYGWPDIENFEDVDRMFRNCDETFGLGSLNNEDELPWFSSSDATETSDDALKSGFNFLCSELSGLKTVSENHETSRPNDAGPSFGVCNKKNISTSGKLSSHATDSDDSALCDLSYVNGSHTRSQNENDSTAKEQINLYKKQSRHQNQSEGKRKVQHLENGGSFHHYGNPENVKQPFGDSICDMYSPSGIGQHNPNVGSNVFCYTQTHMPYINMGYGHPSDKTSVHSTLSITKSENNGDLTPTPKESSYASSQVQSVDSSHVLAFEVSAVTTNEKKEKSYCHDNVPSSFTRSFKHADAASPVKLCDPVSVPKQMYMSEIEIEGRTEGISRRIPTELASSNAQEISCSSSVLDEVSLESSSFCQLQKVMQQLDTRTKLCIRDSLYRLARSAEQRHYCGNPNGGMGDDRDATGALVAEEKNKCGYLDIETDTNPIDRSIAHLLFHRPSDPSIMTTNDPSPLKSHDMVRDCVTSQLANPDKHIFKEDTGSVLDRDLLMNDKK